MKKFFSLLVVGALLIWAFYYFLTSSDLSHPLGPARLLFLAIIGVSGLLVFYEAALSASAALHDFMMRYRRWRRRREKKKTKIQNRLGTTTTVLS